MSDVPGAVQSGTNPASSPGDNTDNEFTSAASAAAANPSGSSTTPAASTASSSTEAPPGAAVSAYEYQQYVASTNVVLGPQIADLMGLSATTQYSGNAVIKAFEDLPYAAVTELESYLYSAGMYANDAGEALDTRPVFGTVDLDAFNALSQALLQTANSGGTLSTYLTTQAASGAGYLKNQTALSPVTGGGKTYQVNLTSPTDVYGTAMNVFQQYLGRNPTAQELNAFTSGYNNLVASYQQGQNTQTEQMAQSVYKQQLASRQATMTPAVAPASGTGQVPNGPFTSPAQYAVAVLDYIGAQPTAQSVALISSWIEANGGLNGKGKFNPLGVQASSPTSTQNASGAQNYTSWAQGLSAAVGLLMSPQYQQLLSAVTTGTTLSAGAQAQLGQWTNGALTTLKPSTADTTAATQAVKNYVPASAPTPAPVDNGEAQVLRGAGSAQASAAGASPTPATGATQLTPGQQTGNLRLQVPQGAAPPVPGAGTASAPTQPVSGASIPVAQVGGTQGGSSPGDFYQPSTTLTDITPPSLTNYLTQQATTGANTTPYLGNQYLQAYQTILNYVKGEF